jgi:hypothetical protein
MLRCIDEQRGQAGSLRRRRGIWGEQAGESLIFRVILNRKWTSDWSDSIVSYYYRLALFSLPVPNVQRFDVHHHPFAPEFLKADKDLRAQDTGGNLVRHGREDSGSGHNEQAST